MKKTALAIILIGQLLLSGCGGGSAAPASSSSGGSASAASCTDAPTLGQATFGSGCFK
jgi:PBP1b-binding outer membrane lipoprotein LpoB